MAISKELEGRSLRARGAHRGGHRRLPHWRRKAPLRRRRSRSTRASATCRVSRRARPSAWVVSTSAPCRAFEHGDDPTDNRLYVDMHIVKREAVRVRQDTRRARQQQGPARRQDDRAHEREPQGPRPRRPRASSKAKTPPTSPTCFPKSATSPSTPRRFSTNLEITTQSLADTAYAAKICARSVHSVNLILKQVAEGNGYVHRLLTDPAEAERVSHLIVTSTEPPPSLRGRSPKRARSMVAIDEGPGFAHELLYGEKGGSARAASAAQRASSPRLCGAFARATGSRTRSFTGATSRLSRWPRTSAPSPATFGRSWPI